MVRSYQSLLCQLWLKKFGNFYLKYWEKKVTSSEWEKYQLIMRFKFLWLKYKFKIKIVPRKSEIVRSPNWHIPQLEHPPIWTSPKWHI